MILSSTSPYGLLKEFSKLLVVSVTTPFFAVVHTIFVHDLGFPNDLLL